MLAAGAGRRFGGPKALVEYRGVRLVDRAVRLLRDGGCGLVVVVTGAAPLEVACARVVHNEGWDTGMGSSLRVGLEAAAGRDVVVVPVDMPWLGPGAVRRVCEAGPGDIDGDNDGDNAGTALAVATYGGRWGHPVLLGGRHHPGVIASVTWVPADTCARTRHRWSRCRATTPGPRSMWTCPGISTPHP